MHTSLWNVSPSWSFTSPPIDLYSAAYYVVETDFNTARIFFLYAPRLFTDRAKPRYDLHAAFLYAYVSQLTSAVTAYHRNRLSTARGRRPFYPCLTEYNVGRGGNWDAEAVGGRGYRLAGYGTCDVITTLAISTFFGILGDGSLASLNPPLT